MHSQLVLIGPSSDVSEHQAASDLVCVCQWNSEQTRTPQSYKKYLRHSYRLAFKKKKTNQAKLKKNPTNPTCRFSNLKKVKQQKINAAMANIGCAA